MGLDLSDPTAKRPRPAAVAVLDPELLCSFWQWPYQEAGSGILPPPALARPFILAIDGPQGLAAREEALMRESERTVNAPGHSPYTLPESGPYAGFIAGSVRLFHGLVTSGSRFRLLGMEGVAPGETNLIEVFPGGGWRVLAGSRRWARKESLQGRRQRVAALEEQGVRFPEGPLPTDDQLDAAMAAWSAYCFDMGWAEVCGTAPWVDPECKVLREGYVVQPRVGEGKEPVDRPEQPVAPV